jgi:hypothetical protein
VGLVPNLADGGHLVGMALGESQGFALAAVPLLGAVAGGSGLGLLAAGLGVAAAAAGGGGGQAATPTAPVGQTGALTPSSDTGVLGDNITNNKITGQYNTDITNDVLGYQSKEDVLSLIERVILL